MRAVPGGVLAALAFLWATSDAPHQESGVLLLPGIVSTAGAIEDGVTMAPDGRELVFSRRPGRWGGDMLPSVLYVTRFDGERWSEPEVLPFSGRHSDGDPRFSPDGRRLFFTSDRPRGAAPRSDRDIWMVERTGTSWGSARHLGPLVNSPAEEYSPVLTASGALYFASGREGGLGQGDLYRALPAGDGWGAPEGLGPVVNSATGEWNVFVTPDESLLVFEASGRPTNRSPSGDLYASYRRDGTWTPPEPLTAINTVESELDAHLTADGERLLFVRSVREADGRRHASVFWVPAAQVLPHLRR